jgi:hypothetical protein
VLAFRYSFGRIDLLILGLIAARFGRMLVAVLVSFLLDDGEEDGAEEDEEDMSAGGWEDSAGSVSTAGSVSSKTK